MESNLLGARELYDVVLKTTCDTIINDVGYKKGEVVGRFPKINLANITEKDKYTIAKGGYGNATLITWKDVQSVSFQFSQGVFSTHQLSILINSQCVKRTNERLLIPFSEFQTADERGIITLKYIPENKEFFIHDKETGKIISQYDLQDNILILHQPFIEVAIDYYTKYDKETSYFVTGKAFTNSYLRLEGKTRLKDDNTGKIVTGIITIPKLRLKSDLSIRLGSESTPMVGTFYGEGYPDRDLENGAVSTLLVLSDDIDSDF